ncbi:hypothetical protein [Spirosoma gilvum]
MPILRLILLLAITLPFKLSAQTITAQLQLNPIHIAKYIPLSLGGGLEVGLSPKSSLQVNGLFLIDGNLGDTFTKGSKAYLAYRYYPNPKNQNNSGLYVSPFVGYGHLHSQEYEDPFGPGSTIQEKLAGVLIGLQPYKGHRFTIDLYAGPEYQWRVADRYTPLIKASHPDRLWLRAGFYFCVRLKK